MGEEHFAAIACHSDDTLLLSISIRVLSVV